MKRSGTCQEGAGSNLDPSSSGVASRSPFFRCRGMFEQIEGEAGNAVFVGYSFKLVAEMLERSEEHTYELQSQMRNSYAGFCLKTKKRIRCNNKSRLRRMQQTYNRNTTKHHNKTVINIKHSHTSNNRPELI